MVCAECRIDPDKPVELGNIVCLHNFYGGVDEEWFRLIHVAIEAKAAATISAIPQAQVVSLQRIGNELQLQ